MGKKGDERRRQIMDKAKSMLLANGPESLVLREVAESLGITHGNLQYYFRTKHDLLRAIFDEEITGYIAGVERAVAATSTTRGRLDAIVDAGFVEVKSPSSALWMMMVGMAAHNLEMDAILKRENRIYCAVVAKALKDVAPHLSTARRNHIAKIINIMQDGFAIHLMHIDPKTSEVRALESEIKAAISALMNSN
jgi:AcrR family transcriptional regulator